MKTKILKTMTKTPIKHDAATDIVRGQLFLFISGLPIAFASNCGLDISAEAIDVSNKMCGDWATALPGKKSFTLSSESVLTRLEGAMSFDTLLGKLISGEVLDFYFGASKTTDATNTGGKFDPDTKQKAYSGSVIITSLSLKSDNGQFAACSASFTGVGALTPVEAVV